MDSDRLVHVLHQSVRSIGSGLNFILEPHGIYSSEWSIITTLYQKKDISQKELANYLCIEPAAISKTVVKLEKKGYIDRKEGLDKREKIVFLTSLALENYPTWQSLVAKHRQALLENTTQIEQQTLYDLLTKIYKNAEHYTQVFKGESQNATTDQRTTLDKKL